MGSLETEQVWLQTLTAPGTAEGSHCCWNRDLDRHGAEAHRPGTDRSHLRGPARDLPECPGGGFLWGPTGPQASHPFSATLRFHQGRLSALDSLPWRPPSQNQSVQHLWPRPQPRRLGSAGLTRHPHSVHTAPAQGLGSGGSYRAVGCPHRHLWPEARHLRIWPRLLAAAGGLVAAPFPPC